MKRKARRPKFEFTGRKYGYARVSTDDQDPEPQIAKLTARGVAREDIFVDWGWSGTIADRPDWLKLWSLLQRGDMVVVTKLDRLSRSLHFLIELVGEDMQERGIGLEVIDQGIDTTTTYGMAFFGFMAVLAELERAMIEERVRDHQEQVRTTGNLRKSYGGVPFLGWRHRAGADDWEMDPVTGKLLREVARRIRAGGKDARVATLLAELSQDGPIIHDPQPDDPDHRYRRVVNAKRLRYALIRPASAGRIVDGEGTYISSYPGEAPLDEDTYFWMRGDFAGRARGRPADPKGRYPLGPILRCGNCGNQLTGRPHMRRAPRPGEDHKDVPMVEVYACRNPHKNGDGTVTKPCGGVSIQTELLHQLVKRMIREWELTSPAARLAGEEPGGEIGSRQAELEALIAQIRSDRTDLLHRRNTDAMDRSRFTEEDEILAMRQARAKASLDAIRTEARRQARTPRHRDWDALPPDQKLSLARLALETPIVVHPARRGRVPSDPEKRIQALSERVKITIRAD